ncbi:hypothetical protein HanPI659440_Chr12g0446951 [Helianthus annuus]|nr:hypothetical protein HanPI659440_Chr12g0446951 [Helianthus annuus]
MGFHEFPHGSNKKLRTFLLTNHLLPRVLLSSPCFLNEVVCSRF